MEEKIQWYKEVLALEPNSRLFFPLAVLLSQNGQKEDALETLRRGLERHDEYLEARIFYIELLYSAQRMSEIEPQLKKLESMFSHYSGFWQAWAAYMASDGRNDTASIMRFLSLYFSHKEISFHDIINRGIQSLLKDEGLGGEVSMGESPEAAVHSPEESGVGSPEACPPSFTQNDAPENAPEDLSLAGFESTEAPEEKQIMNPEPEDGGADTGDEPLDMPADEGESEAAGSPASDTDAETPKKKAKGEIDPSFGTLVTIDKEAEAELWAVISIIEKGGTRKKDESPKQDEGGKETEVLQDEASTSEDLSGQVAAGEAENREDFGQDEMSFASPVPDSGAAGTVETEQAENMNADMSEYIGSDDGAASPVEARNSGEDIASDLENLADTPLSPEAEEPPTGDTLTGSAEDLQPGAEAPLPADVTFDEMTGTGEAPASDEPCDVEADSESLQVSHPADIDGTAEAAEPENVDEEKLDRDLQAVEAEISSMSTDLPQDLADVFSNVPDMEEDVELVDEEPVPQVPAGDDAPLSDALAMSQPETEESLDTAADSMTDTLSPASDQAQSAVAGSPEEEFFAEIPAARSDDDDSAADIQKNFTEDLIQQEADAREARKIPADSMEDADFLGEESGPHEMLVEETSAPDGQPAQAADDLFAASGEAPMDVSDEPDGEAEEPQVHEEPEPDAAPKSADFVAPNETQERVPDDSAEAAVDNSMDASGDASGETAFPDTVENADPVADPDDRQTEEQEKVALDPVQVFDDEEGDSSPIVQRAVDLEHLAARNVLSSEASTFYADTELAEPEIVHANPNTLKSHATLSPSAVYSALNGDDISLRTRSMAEVLAEQGDIKGALDIYCELENGASDVEEAADLKQRVATLRSMLARQRVQEAKAMESVKIDKSRVINLIEALSERLEARAQN